MTARQSVREFKAMTKRVSTSTTIALWVCLGISIALSITSFILPPTGAIDPSVFKALSYIFAFAALFELREAIREGLGVKLTHGSTTIEVHDLDGKDEDKPEDEKDEEEDEDDAM